MELTNENYHSPSSRMAYMGHSQFLRFKRCEAEALAYCKGEIEDKKTTALLVGSYVDAYFSHEMEDFKKTTPDLFKKDGTLKSDFSKADELIKAIEEDKNMLRSLTGENQRIMTGEIAGVPFKIKVDCLRDKSIVDLKVMSSMDPVWNDKERRWENFVDAWGYLYEGCIYREIVRQNTGKILPFYLTVITKEEVPNKAILELDSADLDLALEEVKKLAPRYQAIKEGKIEPEECGECNYCRGKKMVTGVFSYHTLDPYKEKI